MYNKLSANYQKKHIYNYEDEPPEKKLITNADVFIKQLGEKQRNTKTNLQEQLAMKKEFYKANEFRSLTSYVSGSSSLEEFNAVVKSSEEIEKLKSCGLTDDDMELFFDYQRGETYFNQKHKNINENVLKERLEHIYRQIKNLNEGPRNHKEPSRIETELLLAEKPTSLETKLYKFALQNQPSSKEKLPHPMDNLKRIEEQFNQNLSQVNIKKIRRKARSLQKQIDEIQTSQVAESKVNKGACTLSTNSKWDIKDPSTDDLNDQKNIKKVYTCKPQNYYTIKDNQIVKIDSPEFKEDVREERKQLTVEEIKRLPKFENYTPGEPSNVLYLKNLANGVTEDDLKTVFNTSTVEKISSIRVMKGKMKGQAFIEMENEKAADFFLNQCNGIVLKNKPIIIQFGKCKKG